MAQDDAAAAATEPLYRWWLGTLPAFLGVAANDAHGTGAEAPFPAGRMADALRSARDLLDALYGGYLRALIASRPGEDLRAFEEIVKGRVSVVADKLGSLGEALSGHPDLSSLGPAGAPLAAMGAATRPLMLNLERAYGGVADAFGLAPVRELEAAGRDMAQAALLHRRAQAEYLEVVAGALGQGADTLIVRLTEMGQRGESIDTLLALVRQWARATDEAMHEAMQTPRALQASAELIRAAARSRRQQQRIVAIASEALNVPTRAEMDEAYREIQELKRALRRARKAEPPAAAKPAAAAGKTSSRAKRAPRRAGTA